MAKYFFAEKASGWQVVLKKIRTKHPLILLLDYDGTLTPIRRRPEQAMLSERTRELLRELAWRPGLLVGIVTGRSLSDIVKMAGLKEVWYAANHGLEIKFKNMDWIHPLARKNAPLLARVHQVLRQSLKAAQGVLVEDKTYTVSVHYRNLRGWPVSRVKKTVADAVQPHAGKLKLSEGKKVLEIRPDIPWDKGKAALKIIALAHLRQKPLVIYIGDDRTDEDAFRALNPSGITVRVGKKRKTEARYYIKDTAEVNKMLKLLLDFHQAGGRDNEY